jgi:hypothetical protein
MFEWYKILLCILEVPIANIHRETGHPDWRMPFSSETSGKC